MGASTGIKGNRDAAVQQQALAVQQQALRRQRVMEGRVMRRRAMEQQAQAAPTPEQGVAPEFASQEPTGRNPEIGTYIGRGRWSDMPSGIYFGPGRANRVPEELAAGREQLLQKMFNKGQK